MKDKTMLATAVTAFAIALAAFVPTAAFAQQQAVEQFNQHLEQRDASASPAAAGDAIRHATLRSLDHRIERLEQDRDGKEARPSAKPRHNATDVPC